MLNVLAQNIPWFLGGSADLGPSNKTTLNVRGRRQFPGRQPGRQEPAFWHPRTRDGRGGERLVAVEAARLRRDLLHLQRLRAARDPALGVDGDCPRSSSSRTTPWATAKTARPINRWSISLSLARHSRPRHAPARRRERSRRSLPLHHATAPRAGGAGAVPAASADAGSHANTPRRPASRRAPTCSPTLPAKIPE